MSQRQRRILLSSTEVKYDPWDQSEAFHIVYGDLWNIIINLCDWECTLWLKKKVHGKWGDMFKMWWSQTQIILEAEHYIVTFRLECVWGKNVHNQWISLHMRHCPHCTLKRMWAKSYGINVVDGIRGWMGYNCMHIALLEKKMV